MSEEPTEPLPAEPESEIALREHATGASAFEEALVLSAEAIPHRIQTRPPPSASELSPSELAPSDPSSSRPGRTGWTLSVRARDAARALASLAAWRSENRVLPEHTLRRWEGQTPAPIFAALCLAGQLATGPRDEELAWFRRGTADAAAILHGEWWRCATALTLHADLAHAAGNALCGFILIDALARRLGPAWTAWLVLIAGIIGNLLTALVMRTQHFSIGASTAVFGALGALTGVQLLARTRSGFVTLGAGAALLAILGTSARSDLFAHLFGMFAGFLLGLVAGALQREAPEKKTRQPLLAIAALGPLAAAWWLALR